MTVGERIKSARKSKKMSQEELGNLLGIGKSSISEWESGKRPIPIDTMEEIADHLQVTVPYLMGWEASAETLEYKPLELSPAALDIARRFDSLDPYSQLVVSAVVNLESKRPAHSYENMIENLSAPTPESSSPSEEAE